MTVRTRFAPSPTGVLHLGSVRTALFCWLYARRHKGQFILRIEDTDRERSTEENVNAILDGMDWLGLEADEGPFYQTHRYERYGEVIDAWLAADKAYLCYCTKVELDALRATQMENGEKTRYNGKCRHGAVPREDVEPVVRFKNPLEGEVLVDDQVRGRVVFQNAELDDLIIRRSDGNPTYNFTVVVDDYDMQISHVIRGDDHLNNTPRQMNMLAALGAEPPVYGHLPMILGPDGAKLSKRHGAVDIRAYREQGFLPEAVLNYLVRLGWSHGDQELFSIEEMTRFFDIADVNQSASTFNPEKLRWINQQHIQQSTPAEVGRQLLPYLVAAGLDPESGPAAELVALGFRERAETLVEMTESARYCFEDFDEIDPKSAKNHLRPVILDPFEAVIKALESLPEWNEDAISRAVQETADKFEINMGKLGQPIRVAVTGGPVSPPINTTLFLIGRRRSLQRLSRALDMIRQRAESAA